MNAAIERRLERRVAEASEKRTEDAERIAHRAVLRIVMEHEGSWGNLMNQLDEMQAIIAEEIEHA